MSVKISVKIFAGYSNERVALAFEVVAKAQSLNDTCTFKKKYLQSALI